VPDPILRAPAQKIFHKNSAQQSAPQKAFQAFCEFRHENQYVVLYHDFSTGSSICPFPALSHPKRRFFEKMLLRNIFHNRVVTFKNRS